MTDYTSNTKTRPIAKKDLGKFLNDHFDGDGKRVEAAYGEMQARREAQRHSTSDAVTNQRLYEDQGRERGRLSQQDGGAFTNARDAPKPDGATPQQPSGKPELCERFEKGEATFAGQSANLAKHCI